MSRIRKFINGTLSEDNSTDVILGIGGVFTGTSEDVEDYVESRIAVFSDVASAADGLSVEYSTDGTNWDHTDTFTVPAGVGKNYVIQRVARYFRIVYTNGSTGQASFRLSTIFNSVHGVASAHRLDDDITSEDDATLNISVIKTVGSDPTVFHTVDSQHPFPTDGDSLYLKDVDVPNSDNGGFSGVVTDYFDSLKTVNNDATATNPKSITVWFNRTIQTHAIAFGCDDLTKSFSNIKVLILGSGEEVRYTWDGSADNTKRNSYAVELPSLFLNGFTVEFHTADEIGLSNIYMPKSTDVHSTLSASKTDGTVVDIGASDSGNLKVTDAENGLAIAKGEVPGSTFIHKFGAALDFDTDDLEVTLWDGADDGDLAAMAYTYSVTDDIDSITSSSGADTVDVEVKGLDINYALVVQTVTLTGQAVATLSTPLLRVFRMKNVGAVDLVGDVYLTINGAALTAGVPNVATDLRAQMHIGNNQTLMAMYTVPAGTTGYMRDWFASTAGANRSTNYAIRLKARPFGGVFQLKHLAAISDIATSYIDHNYSEPEVYLEKTDVELTATITDTGITNAAVSGGFDIVIVDN